jgi:hypothetical protein
MTNGALIRFSEIAQMLSQQYQGIELILRNDGYVDALEEHRSARRSTSQNQILFYCDRKPDPAFFQREDLAYLLLPAAWLTERESFLAAHERLNLILLGEEAPESAVVLNALCNFFLRRASLMTHLHHLWELAASAEDLKTILTKGTQLFERPFQVFSPKFNLIAFSEHPDFSDIGVEEMNRRGKFSDEVMESYAENNYIHRLKGADSIVCLQHRGRSHDSVWRRILSVDGRHLGYLTTFSDLGKPLSVSDVMIINSLSHVVAHFLSIKDDLQEINVLKFEQQVVSALEEHISNAPGFLTALRSNSGLRWDRFQLFTIRVGGEPDDNTPYEYISSRISERIPNSRCMVYKQELLLLVSLDEDSVLEQLETRLQELLVPLRLEGGASAVYTDIFQLKLAYQESSRAMEVGSILDPDRGFYSWEDYLPYYPIHMYGQSGDLYKLCDPRVMSLFRYDRENKTSLLETVRAYMNCRCRIMETAIRLDVHRNSLYYRFNMINNIVGVDLNEIDEETYLSFRHSLNVLEYLKMIPFQRRHSRV